MILRFIVLVTPIFSLPLFSTPWDLKWVDERKASCPQLLPPRSTDVQGQIFEPKCGQLRSTALAAKCITEDTFKKMELCDFVPVCLGSRLQTWVRCEPYDLHGPQSLLSNCDRNYDSQFAKNCLIPTQNYDAKRPVELEYSIRYTFVCETASKFPLKNIGFATENGFKPFEQTTNGVLKLAGREYLSLVDLNPELTKETGIDRDCFLSVDEIKKELSAQSREKLKQNLESIKLLSSVLQLLGQVETQIYESLDCKLTEAELTELLRKTLESALHARADLLTDNASKVFFDLTIGRIQEHLERRSEKGTEDSQASILEMKHVLKTLIAELADRIKELDTESESVAMLSQDKELFDQYKMVFDELREKK